MPKLVTWVDGYVLRGPGTLPSVQRASYSVVNLAERQSLSRADVASILQAAGLRDYSFDVVWHDEVPTPDATLNDKIENVEGYVVFLHGWTGNRRIWELMPEEVVRRNPRLVSVVVDHNGFGQTPFITDLPEFETCSPIAAMRAVEKLVAMLKLRRQPDERQPKIVNFVGHSMGGAALFFLDDARWDLGEDTRLALAPALLLRDEGHRVFYNTLGLGIGLVGLLPFLEHIERFIKPGILDTLVNGASRDVRQTHVEIYDSTPRGITARTLASMGTLVNYPMTHDNWDLMRVVLGHRDPLVGLVPMLDLLNELNFNVEQVRVVMGTHYLFSVGDDYNRVHRQNLELVLSELLTLHNTAYQRFK